MAREVTESALMAALSFLLFFAGNLLGFLVILVPVPLAIVGYRYGVKRAIMSCAVAAALVSLITGGLLQGYFYVTPFGLLGVITGWMLRREGSASNTLMAGTLIMTLAMTPALTPLEKALTSENSYAQLQKMMATVLDQKIKDTPSPEEREQYTQLKTTFTILLGFPIALMFLASLTLVYISHLVSYKVLGRLDIPVRPPPDPRNFRMSLWVLALLPMSFFFFVQSGANKTSIYASLGLNCLYICGQVCWLGSTAAVARLIWPDRVLPVPAFLLLGFFCLGLIQLATLVAISENISLKLGWAKSAEPSTDAPIEAPATPAENA
jgi:uncharacterized protein YybS (DUF2232 family)